MIDGLRRVLEESVKRLGTVVAETGQQVVRRYRGARLGVDTDISVKETEDAAGGADVDRQAWAVRGGGERTPPVGVTPPLMSVDQFLAGLRDGERSGVPEMRTPAYMVAGNNQTDLFVYPNGFEVIQKVGLPPMKQSAEILAAAVGRAIGAPVAPVIAGAEGSLLMQRLPGRTVPGTPSDPGACEAMEAIKNTPGARKLGLLDVLVRNWDRPNNWLRHGDDIYGYDHAESFREDRDFDPGSNPFSSHYGVPGVPGSGRWNEWTPNDLSRTELDRYEAEITALRPLFEEHARLDWATEAQPLAWHDDVLSRVARLREHATRP
ncbi:hypothetical protein [Nocardia carnea]|uniref:hypothetical protein n=1 Tax=Nocardia carnea TaxID=37328 RepID=UPI0024548F47|nr:hypothetical protein [Nocardia carnea]